MNRYKKILLGLSLACSFSSPQTYGSENWAEAYNQWKKLAVGGQYIQPGFANIPALSSAKNLLKLRVAYANQGLYSIYAQMSNEQIESANQHLIGLLGQDLPKSKVTDHLPNPKDTVEFINLQQAQELFQAMVSTPVVENQLDYGSFATGFCFMRATVAHYQSLIRNIHPSSIRKIWVRGDMGDWGHHVATMVKSKDGWYVIDNYTGLMTGKQWIERMKLENNSDKPSLFFVTRAGRVGIQSNNLYNLVDIFGDFFFGKQVSSTKLEKMAMDKNQQDQIVQDDFYNGIYIDFFDYLAQIDDQTQPFEQTL